MSSLVEEADSPVYPQDWNNPYAQPPYPQLSPVLPPATMNSANSSAGFQPSAAEGWLDNSGFWRHPLPDGSAQPGLNSSGAAGIGQTAQPQADIAINGPNAGAGATIGGAVKGPPPGSETPAPEAAPQGPPTLLAKGPAPGADTAPNGEFGPNLSNIAQAVPADPLAAATLHAEHSLAAGSPKSNWLQRLGFAILSTTKLAPYAMQITHPQWAQQMAAEGAQQKSLEGLAQTQAAVLQNQQVQQQMQDAAVLRSIYTDAAAGKIDQATLSDPTTFLQAFGTRGGRNINNALSAMGSMTSTQKNRADMQKALSDAELARSGAKKAGAETLDIQRNSAIQDLQAVDPRDAGSYARWAAVHPELNPPPQYDPEYVTRLVQTTIPAQQQPATQLEQLKVNAIKNFAQNPQGVLTAVDAMLPASKYPELNNALHQSFSGSMATGDYDRAKKVLDDAASYVQDISKETDPNLMRARVQQAVQTEMATSRYKIGQAVATAKALRMGDNPAVAGVAPAFVGQVQNQAIKLDTDYAGAKAATETLGRVLDLAEQGNAAAGVNVTSLGSAGIAAVNDIKRLNPALVENYGNAGSILQDIQGKLSHWAGTGPFPNTLLEEIRQLHQTIGQQAYQTYTDGLHSLNARANSRYEPTLPPPNISGKINVQIPGQPPGQIPAKNKAEFLRLHPDAKVF